MSALFGDARIGDHHNAVGVLDGGEPVGNDRVVRPSLNSASDAWIRDLAAE